MQRKNKYTFHIVLLIYLAGQNFFNPLGILSQQMGKLLFYISFLIGLIYAIQNGINLKKIKYPRLSYQMLVGGMIGSIFMAYFFQEQSFTTTFISTIPYLISYAYFYILLKFNVEKGKIEKLFQWLTIISAFMYVCNLIAFPTRIFGEAIEEIDTSRGFERLGVPMIEIIVLYFFYSINQWMTTNQKKWIYWIILTSILIVISLTRQIILISALLGFLFIMKRATIYKKLIVISTTTILALYILPQTTLYQTMVELSLEQIDKNTYQKEDIRITAWKYYTIDNQTNSITSILGNGVPAYGKSKWGTSFMKEVEYEYGGNGCFTADVGWAGFYWYFGILSVVGLLSLLIKGIFTSRSKNEAYLSYGLLFILISAVTSAPILHFNQILSLSFILYLAFTTNINKNKLYDRNSNIKLQQY